MIIIKELPAQIQVPKHTDATDNLSFALYDSTGEVFTSEAVTIDGLHYKVLVDADLKEGNYRYQVMRDQSCVELGLLTYNTGKSVDTYSTENKVFIYNGE